MIRSSLHRIKNMGYFVKLKEVSPTSSDELKVVQIFTLIHWASQRNKVELWSVPLGSTEWTNIQRRFQASLQAGTITSIQRIQNKQLWRSYVQERHQLSKKNKNVINERLLFHGTSGVLPEKVYKSERGFDYFRSTNIRRGWGEGAHFAVNAGYTNRYAYTFGQTKQIILALVVLGESYKCRQPDESLKQPPKKRGGGMCSNERYDSVSGTIDGSEIIYVIYDHKKAYPAYIIKYK